MILSWTSGKPPANRSRRLTGFKGCPSTAENGLIPGNLAVQPDGMVNSGFLKNGIHHSI
jgi:hypothetical protein